jgi:hypothetical protein
LAGGLCVKVISCKRKFKKFSAPQTVAQNVTVPVIAQNVILQGTGRHRLMAFAPV